MTYGMASITKKTIRGKPYYYARECKRVNGKPKIVWQQYLGRPEDIIEAMTERRERRSSVPQPDNAIVTEFGAVAALYDLAQRLDLTATVDRHVPKRGSGPSVGTYLLVAILNRCVAPCSKASIGMWFQGTVLRRLVDIETRQLTSQRYWDNMDRVSSDAIQAIERDITGTMVREFEIDMKQVLFDATNFFTFIDTFNERSTLAQRGKSKEGRAALRIVGLALLVSADFHIPLLHHTYPGNQTDAPTFASLTSALADRCREISQTVENITIVFDKGNNSQDNLDAIEDTHFHFVGSLVYTQHKDLLDIPKERFQSLAHAGLRGVSAYRCTRSVFGQKRTVLVTFNENLFVSQSKTLLREIGKRLQRFRDLSARLERRRRGEIRGGKPPTLEGTRKKVDGWLKAQHMKDLFDVEIVDQDGLPAFTYRFNQEAWEHLQESLLGKTILFTDNDDWTDAEIVHGYRAQHHVERAFRTMKDPQYICLRPQHHWTDQKVEVHVFCCVLALMLSSLLRRELHRSGIDRSIPALLHEMGQIREVAVVYPPEKGQSGPTFQWTLSEMSEEQRMLYDAMALERYR